MKKMQSFRIMSIVQIKGTAVNIINKACRTP